MRLTVPTAVIVDTTPLGLLMQRLGHVGGDTGRRWYASLLATGCQFFVPEIADYELRRKLLQVRNAGAVARLNAFVSAVPSRYLPLTTTAVRLAADLWSQARQKRVRQDILRRLPRPWTAMY